MKLSAVFYVTFSLSAILTAGCANNPVPSPTNVAPAACLPAPSPTEFAYALTGTSVSMYTVGNCGKFTASAPATVATGAGQGAEQMVTDPLGRFAYVANLVSNASPISTISMYTIDPKTGVLTPTSPATVATGWFPQEIAIDPQGRFVYTANTDDSSVSAFTINQATGVLTPTSPASVSTLLPGELLSDPKFLP